MPWWKEKPMRLIQNNLRDIDAQMDVDRLLEKLRKFSCNTLMIGAGGITSFYPTKLAYQRSSPYLGKRDLLAELLDKCHMEGIRVIARFDFSKTHESFYDEHPEWYYRSKNGESVRYNDTVHTCVNGWYQQEYSLVVLEEVLSRYPVDGIFFNMFGFTTGDYSGRYYGICHCDACKKRFAEFSGGMQLPDREESENMDETEKARLSLYRQFQRKVTSDILHRIHQLVRSKGDDIAVCTYYDQDVDIIRNESNSAVDCPLPFLLYQSSVNVQTATGIWPEKLSTNCVTNAADIFYRFSGVSPELTKIRLYENMAAGGALDYCIIGVFDGYPDQAGVTAAEEVFAFHKKYENIFGHLQSLSKVRILRPSGYAHSLYGEKNFLGIFRVLKEEHICFDICSDQQVLRDEVLLTDHHLVIIPYAADISCEAIVHLHQMGIPMLICGAADGLGFAAEQELGIQLVEKQTDTRAAYLSVEGQWERKTFAEIADRGWVLLDKDFGRISAPGWEVRMPLIQKAWFGPPERCFGHKVEDFGGVLVEPGGKTVVLPWEIGKLYHDYGYADYRCILSGIIHQFPVELSPYTVQAPACVEVFWNRTDQGVLIQMLNLSGFDGVTFSSPLSVMVQIQLPDEVKQITLLEKDNESHHSSDVLHRINGKEWTVTLNDRYTAVLLA